MTKDEILTLVGDLCLEENDTDASTRFFDDALESLSKAPLSPLADFATVTITSGNSEYALPSDAIRILALFYADAHLPAATVEELEALDKDWQSTTGDPYAYTIDEITARSYYLFPTPTSSGDDGTVIYTETREDDLEDWLALPVAFDILYREFVRPSAHQDITFAEASQQCATLLKEVAGIQ